MFNQNVLNFAKIYLISYMLQEFYVKLYVLKKYDIILCIIYYLLIINT